MREPPVVRGAHVGRGLEGAEQAVVAPPPEHHRDGEGPAGRDAPGAPQCAPAAEPPPPPGPGEGRGQPEDARAGAGQVDGGPEESGGQEIARVREAAQKRPQRQCGEQQAEVLREADARHPDQAGLQRDEACDHDRSIRSEQVPRGGVHRAEGSERQGDDGRLRLRDAEADPREDQPERKRVGGRKVMAVARARDPRAPHPLPVGQQEVVPPGKGVAHLDVLDAVHPEVHLRGGEHTEEDAEGDGAPGGAE